MQKTRPISDFKTLSTTTFPVGYLEERLGHFQRVNFNSISSQQPLKSSFLFLCRLNSTKFKDDPESASLAVWADRTALELHRREEKQLREQPSTDLSTDQSASTSFESNTEPVQTEGTSQQRYSSFLALPYSADKRREKYR
ncbi:hypothetical protein AB6A40_011017 [Gnathostoma spinigerum]|uniref:Uncharacterized protein n=1 Tax=Gnathostoma spinigerum TaxID=75299 RepID=A0ABD6EWH5_9BILA